MSGDAAGTSTGEAQPKHDGAMRGSSPLERQFVSRARIEEQSTVPRIQFIDGIGDNVLSPQSYSGTGPAATLPGETDGHGTAVTPCGSTVQGALVPDGTTVPDQIGADRQQVAAVAAETLRLSDCQPTSDDAAGTMAGGLQSFALSTGDVFADARCSSGGDVGTDAGPTIVSRPTSTRIAVSNEPSQEQVYLSSTEIGTGVPTQARRRIIIRRSQPAAGDVDPRPRRRWSAQPGARPGAEQH